MAADQKPFYQGGVLSAQLPELQQMSDFFDDGACMQERAGPCSLTRAATLPNMTNFSTELS